MWQIKNEVVVAVVCVRRCVLGFILVVLVIKKGWASTLPFFVGLGCVFWGTWPMKKRGPGTYPLKKCKKARRLRNCSAWLMYEPTRFYVL